VTDEERKQIQAQSPLVGKYETVLDRESAYEVLNGQREVESAPASRPQTKSGGIDWGARPVPAPLPLPEAQAPRESTRGSIRDREPPRAKEKESSGGWLSDMLGGNSKRQGVGEAAIKSVTRSVSSTIGREIGRSILGSILGGKRR